MGTLRDEVYEKLDYLSQLTEVVFGPQNVVLGRAPDRIELTFDEVNKLKRFSWSGRNGFKVTIANILVSKLPKPDWDYIPDIQQHFKFEVSDDLELDMVNKKMTGTVALVKTLQQIDEKDLLQAAVDKSTRLLSSYDWPAKRLRDKIATVLNVFEPGSGIEWAKKLDGRVASAGQQEIRKVFTAAILENKWRIRDATVILKVGEWINSYLRDEDNTSTGLVNLLKLKMMLDKDLPVYSVDEVKNADTM